MHFPAIIESLPEPPDDSPATLPAPTGPVEYEVHVDGELVAGASGLREDSLREAMHYAAQYADDGEVEVFEVRRIPLVAPTAKGGE